MTEWHNWRLAILLHQPLSLSAPVYLPSFVTSSRFVHPGPGVFICLQHIIIMFVFMFRLNIGATWGRSLIYGREHRPSARPPARASRRTTIHRRQPNFLINFACYITMARNNDVILQVFISIIRRVVFRAALRRLMAYATRPISI